MKWINNADGSVTRVDEEGDSIFWIALFDIINYFARRRDEQNVNRQQNGNEYQCEANRSDNESGRFNRASVPKKGVRRKHNPR
jgi:hypothetical protein